jgi:predicted MFS family arabinose efflux permease
MFSRRLKTGYFLLEGLNSFATVYYFYYLYFFMQKAYGFGNKSNLMLAALNGATYASMSWFGGRFAQRYGYFIALKVGQSIMILALSLGLAAQSASAHVSVMVLTVVGMSFTWPTLEALISEGESRAGLQHMVGIYNLVWASTAALANFSGGAMLQKLGFASLFYVPIAVNLSQLGLTLWLERKANAGLMAGAPSRVRLEPGGTLASGSSRAGLAPGGLAASSQVQSADSWRSRQTNGGVPTETERDTLVSGEPSGADLSPGAGGSSLHEVPIVLAKRFLRMAWLANPFAYIAINTLIAVVPGVARRLELSTMAAGFCCSTWCFARVGAFAVLWRWTRWHYRFRWLLLAFAGLVGSFGAVVLAPNLAVLVIAQLIFGSTVGLIYYSSLFYSMDRSETKGEHGGIHEAAIGLGNCAGPAVGAAALQLVPQHVQSGTVAVIGLLLCGFGGLLWIWKTKSVNDERSFSRVT